MSTAKSLVEGYLRRLPDNRRCFYVLIPGSPTAGSPAVFIAFNDEEKSDLSEVIELNSRWDFALGSTADVQSFVLSHKSKGKSTPTAFEFVAETPESFQQWCTSLQQCLEQAVSQQSSTPSSSSESNRIRNQQQEVAAARAQKQKESAQFQKLFNLPSNEDLIDSFSCAIQKSILLHGRLYCSQNFICFHSNIFGHTTSLSIPISQVVCVQQV